MKIALIGGIGYLGGRLAPYLKANRHHVRATTRRPLRSVPSWFSADDVVRDDLKSVDVLKKHLAGCDAVIHLASPDEKAAERDPRAALRAGGETVWNVLEAIAGLNKKPLLLYLSTFHVYGRMGHGRISESALPVPAHPYGLSRYVGENVAQVFRQQKGIKALCVRLSNVFGPPADFSVPRWTLVAGDLCLQSVTQKKLIVRSPPALQRNFIPMEDAVRALGFLVCRAPRWPADGVIHLGFPRSMTLDELARRVARCTARLWGYTPPIVHLSNARPGSTSLPLRYSVQRLKAMGFSWNGPIDREITDTLRMCSEALRKFGPKVYNACGLAPGKLGVRMKSV